MEEPSPRFRLVSWTFIVGFGLGAFVGVALGLLAFAVTPKAPDTEVIVPSAEAVDLPDPLTNLQPATATPDARPRTKTELDVRLGPGTNYAIVGTLTRGQAVEVVGRDNDASWAAIRFPPGSPARGWVPVAQLDGLTAVESLTVALPTPLPRTLAAPGAVVIAGGNDGGFVTGISSPASATTSTAGSSSPVAGGTLLPAGTATPRTGATDLAVTRVGILPDGRISVTVTNRGPGDIVGQQVFVLVRDLSVHSELLVSGTRGLASGDAITMQTGSFRIDDLTEVQAVVDPNNGVVDSNRANNVLNVTLSLPQPTVTPTPQ